MENRERICRFCFEKCSANFIALERTRREMLNILLVTMNLSVTDEPVMCTNCTEILQNCFVFKKTCLDSRDHAIAFGNDGDSAHTVCEFCRKLLENSSFTTLDIEENISGNTTMLEKYFPELDLGGKKPVICEACHGCLVSFFSFVTISSTAEEKIKEYCEAEGVNNTDPIKLNDVLKFTSENMWKENNEFDVFKMNNAISVKSENEDLSIKRSSTVAKNSMTYCETPDIYSKDQIELSNSLQLAMMDVTTREVNGNSEDIIKVEDDRNTVKLEQIDDSEDAIKDVENIAGENNKLGSFKTEEIFCDEVKTEHKVGNFVEMEDNKCLFNEEIEIKTDDDDFNSFEGGNISPQVEITGKLYRRDNYSILNLEKDQSNPCINHASSKKHNPKIRKTFQIGHEKSTVNHNLVLDGFKKDLLVHKDPSEVTMYKYNSDSFETKRKDSTRQHLLKHSETTMYKCDSCSFQTNLKYNFKLHLQEHKYASELKVFKCDFCSYETTRKNSLARHSLKQKVLSDLTVYRCDFCSFMTKHKCSLKDHLLKHKDPSDLTVYKCGSCSYQTSWKYALKRHLRVHPGPLKETVYKCDRCSFQTKYKDSLKNHSLQHTDPLEVTKYKCDSCSFETKHKGSIKRHVIIHKDPSKVTSYKCNSCSFQTNVKYSFKQHVLMHTDPSELKVYKCDFCSFETIHRNGLACHLLTHKDPSDLTVYKCDLCSFETKHKNNLKCHSLKHKDPSDITYYKCDKCSYQAIWKYRLKRHLLIHNKPLDKI